MQIFFAHIIDNQTAKLDSEEARHCQKVLRHQPGDAIYITDGSGTMFLANILFFSASGAALEIAESFPGYGESKINVRLAVSFLRLKDRFEWLMEKAVELGVTEIFPLICARTDKFKGKIKEERLEKIILTALKQSARSKLPSLHEALSVEKFVKMPTSGFRALAWCETQTMLQIHESAIRQADTVTLMIGPEGDFTAEEANFAKEHGYEIVSLGETRLRTETAAIYGLSVFKMLRE